MSDIEDLEREARELEESIAQIEREHGDEAKGIGKETAELDRRVDGLRKSRGAASAKVDPAVHIGGSSRCEIHHTVLDDHTPVDRRYGFELATGRDAPFIARRSQTPGQRSV